MATDRVLVCPQCGPFPTTGKLFDVLLARAREEPLRCAKCSGLATLRLKFPFGLNAADSECTVRDCFVPRTLEVWKEKDGSNVTFSYGPKIKTKLEPSF